MKTRVPVSLIRSDVGALLLLSTIVAAQAQYVTVIDRDVEAAAHLEWSDLPTFSVPKLSSYKGTGPVAYVSVTTNSLVTGQELVHATALQDSLGFSALTTGFTDDTRTTYEKCDASAVYTIAVQNETAGPLPMRMHMQVMPGRLRLRDETANGLRYASGTGADLNFLRTSVLFQVMTNNFLRVANYGRIWQWQRSLEGGRAGASNLVSIIDLSGIGTPPVTRGVSPDGTVIEDAWDSFTATIEFGLLQPGEQFMVQYLIQVKTSGSDDYLAGAGTTGTLVEAGDPFELASGQPEAVAGGLVFKVGDLVMGMLKPLKISNFSRVADRVEFSFNADPDRGYQVEFRDTLATGNWSTLTNIAPRLVASLVRIEDTSTPDSRFYRVRSE